MRALLRQQQQLLFWLWSLTHLFLEIPEVVADGITDLTIKTLWNDSRSTHHVERLTQRLHTQTHKQTKQQTINKQTTATCSRY